jgi:anthranilate phosphoribosyltransferase
VQEAAGIFDRVLANTASQAQINCVVANAAFAIRVICPQKSVAECIAQARESIESGRALKTFTQFLALNS